MERIVEQGLLYDFYGALLNEHQRDIYEAYVYENLSLSEIAVSKGISRQGVHDLIKRCDKSLEDYENRLHLVAKFMVIRKDIEKIEELSKQDEVRDLAEKILENL
ncbi:MAG: YlxM family DNA-binding protein [Lachnospiraceae bacterium]|nr:YlxM family DNA-binding protein [Lachnospiraceae bacterium]